jgi:hypothetical protein
MGFLETIKTAFEANGWRYTSDMQMEEYCKLVDDDIIKLGDGGTGIDWTSATQNLSTTGSITGGAMNANGNIAINALNTEPRSLTIGQSRSGDGLSHIDLVSSSAEPDYGARIIKNTGANGNLEIKNTGISNTVFVQEDGGNFVWSKGGITLATMTGTELFLNNIGLRPRAIVASTNTALTAADQTVFCSFGTTQTITLPPLPASTGQEFFIKKVSGSGNVNIVGDSGQLIEGSASKTISLVEGSFTLKGGVSAWSIISDRSDPLNQTLTALTATNVNTQNLNITKTEASQSIITAINDTANTTNLAIKGLTTSTLQLQTTDTTGTNSLINLINDPAGLNKLTLLQGLTIALINTNMSKIQIGTTADFDVELVRNNSTKITLGATKIKLAIGSVPTFADDASAGAGGVVQGELYKHADGVLAIKL